MRIEQTNVILKESQINRLDHQRHERNDTWLARAKKLVSNGSTRITSLMRQLLPRKQEQ